MNPHSGNKNEYRAIGMMSGTSLDGLDIASCLFTRNRGTWKFKIEDAVTISYPDEWASRLANAHNLNSLELVIIHSEYGNYLGEMALEFMKNTDFIPDLIASHGHTIFHEPEKGITFQAGNGAMIASLTGIPTVADFRITDVALGGQGAPLVPAGDRLLFPDYNVWLNLGGFANISMIENGKTVAFDICPVNFVLNHFAGKLGQSFDKDGETGRNGKLNDRLLRKLNTLDYYQLRAPKSLGREWVEKYFIPAIDLQEISVPDILHTLCEHIGLQVSGNLVKNGIALVTGGGAFNRYLIERIRALSKTKLVIPEVNLIHYKEALIFAFLGVLRILGEVNCFSSVTGARKDSSCGIIFKP